MSTSTPEAGSDLHLPSQFAEAAAKGDSPTGDLKWSLGGQPPEAAHFPTDEERKILAEMAAAEKIEAEKEQREKAEEALATAKKKAAAAKKTSARS